MKTFEPEVAYPRLAMWTAVGAVLFLVSGLVNVVLVSIDVSLALVSFALRYLGASLFAMGAFFYCLNWTVDYGPEFLRRLFT